MLTRGQVPSYRNIEMFSRENYIPEDRINVNFIKF